MATAQVQGGDGSIEEEIMEHDSWWVPLPKTDTVLLFMAFLHQVLVMAAVTHLLWCRTWPPYAVKNVPLVCFTGIAGSINLVGIVLSFGFLEYDHPCFLTNCFFQGIVAWTGAGLYYCTAVVRVYRSYKVLIEHTAEMMSSLMQILILQAPIWVATLSLLLPSVAEMDYDSNRCVGDMRYVLLAGFNYAAALLVFATYLLWKMRKVRKQMNEYRVMIMSLGFLFVSVALIDTSAGGFRSDSPLTRRSALVNNILRSALIFWPVIFMPVVKYLLRDDSYAEKFAAGSTPRVTPVMLRTSLSAQLKVEDLWLLFREVAYTKLIPALPDFYKAVMDRDKEVCHFERQAKTMDVIETFINENSPRRVEVSDGCRHRILNSEVTRYTIFCEASGEVLKMMQETCQEYYQASSSYNTLLRKAETEEPEIDAIRKAKLAPKARSVAFHSATAFESPTASRSDRWTNSTVNGSMGNRSEVASQHKFGESSPTNRSAGGWGWSSSVPWLAEEDLETGRRSSPKGEPNTRPSSTLSVATRLAGSSKTTYSKAAPPVSKPAPGKAAALSATPRRSPFEMSSPSPAGGRRRSKSLAPLPQKRSPPAPWAPWRRSPERVIVPTMCSPPSDLEVTNAAIAMAKRETDVDEEERKCLSAVEEVGDDKSSMGSGGPGATSYTMAADRTGSSPDSLSSVLIFLPPSPVALWSPLTPQCLEKRSFASVHDGKRQLQRRHSLSGPDGYSEQVEQRSQRYRRDSAGCTESRLGVTADAQGDASELSWSSSRTTRGVIAPWRQRSVRVRDVEDDEERRSVTSRYTSKAHSDFEAATEVMAADSFVPSMKLLDFAIKKEAEENRRAEVENRKAEVEKRRAEMASGIAPMALSTNGLLAVAVETDSDEDAMVAASRKMAEAAAQRVGMVSLPSSPGTYSNKAESGVVESCSGVDGAEKSEGGRLVNEVSSRSPSTSLITPSICHSSKFPHDRQAPPAEPPSIRPPPPQTPLPVTRESSHQGGDNEEEEVIPPLSFSLPKSLQPWLSPKLSLALSTPSGLQMLRSPMSPSTIPQFGSGLSCASSIDHPSPTAAPQEKVPLSPIDTNGQVKTEGRDSLAGGPDPPLYCSVMLTYAVSPLPTTAARSSRVRLEGSPPTTGEPTTLSGSQPKFEEDRSLLKLSPALSTPTPEDSRHAGGTGGKEALFKNLKEAVKGRGEGERVPRSRVAPATKQAQAAALMTPQPPTTLLPQVNKTLGPARAQPTRAPAWIDPPPFRTLSKNPLCAIPVDSFGAPSSSPSKTPPLSQQIILPQPLLPLSLGAIGPPTYLFFMPPSPAGRSTSASPSSVRSSPVVLRPPLLPPNAQHGRDMAASGANGPLAWSWSESTLSGCSRSGGAGGGGALSSASRSASACSDGASPLVGMRFVLGVEGVTGCGGGGSDGIFSKERPRSSSGSDLVADMLPGGLPLMWARSSPPLLAVGRCGDTGNYCADPHKHDTPVESRGTAGRAMKGPERQKKKPRRCFFP